MFDADQGVLDDDGLRAAEANPALPAMATERPRSRPFEAAGDRGRTLVRAHWVTAAVLAWIVLFGLSLRLTNVNWDHGQALHPDERFLMIITDKLRAPDSVGQYWDSAESPLNPYNHNDSFVYGTFPLFLNKTVAEWLDRDADGSTHTSANIVKWPLEAFGADFDRDNGTRNFDGGYNSRIVGRVLSALFDVLTILLIFELGRILYGRIVGLLAAGFLAATVLHIQHAHFFGSETFLALFVTAVIYFSVRIWKYGSFVKLRTGRALLRPRPCDETECAPCAAGAGAGDHHAHVADIGVGVPLPDRPHGAVASRRQRSTAAHRGVGEDCAAASARSRRPRW